MTKTDGLVWGTWSLMLMCFFLGARMSIWSICIFFLEPAMATCIHCEMSVYIVAHVENSGITTPEPRAKRPPSFWGGSHLRVRNNCSRRVFWGWGSGEKVPQKIANGCTLEEELSWKIMFLSNLVICIFHVDLPGCGCFCLPEMRNCHSYSSSWNHFLRKTSRRCVLGGNTKTKWAPNRYKHDFNFTCRGFNWVTIYKAISRGYKF